MVRCESFICHIIGGFCELTGEFRRRSPKNCHEEPCPEESIPEVPFSEVPCAEVPIPEEPPLEKRQTKKADDAFCTCLFCDGRSFCSDCGHCDAMCVCPSSSGLGGRVTDAVDGLMSEVNDLLYTPDGDDEELIEYGEELIDELEDLLASPNPRRFNLANAAVMLNTVCALRIMSSGC